MPSMPLLRSLVLAAGLACLSGCADERPVFVVIESGDEALAASDYELAATEYREAVSRRPAEWQARMGLAEALLGLGRSAAAREQAELVYSVRPGDAAAVELLAETMLASGDTAGMDALLRSRANDTNASDDWLTLGQFLARAGDADLAETALLKAETVDQGRSLKYQTALADFYLEIGDNAEALTRYRMALFIDPADEATRAAIQALGQIPGPTLALPPREAL